MDKVERQKGNGRLDVLVFVIIAALGAPVPGFGQWVRYPTADVPTKADGTPDLTAPTPRLPDGKPDFSGIWHAAAINQCVPSTGQFCGLEIGGSPLALNIGKDLPGGLPYQPWAAELVKQRSAKTIHTCAVCPTILRAHGECRTSRRRCTRRGCWCCSMK